MTASVERSFSQIKLIKSRLEVCALNDKKMKMALVSPVELTDSDLEEIYDVWNRKNNSSLGEFDTI